MKGQPTVRPVIGCIADDFTGATDLAGLLARGGMQDHRLNPMTDSNLVRVLAAQSHQAVSGLSVDTVEELEETAKLFLLLRGEAVRWLTDQECQEVRERFPD